MSDPIYNDVTNNVYSLFPIKYESIYSLYNKGLDSFWRVQEIDLSKDLVDWYTLSEPERRFLLCMFAFFSQADNVVMENLLCCFIQDCKIAESRSFYSLQVFMESVHSEMYSLLIDTFATKEEKPKLYNAIDNFPCIQAKADWAKKYMARDKPFAERLVAFAAVEGIFFSGAFASLYWIKKRGILPGTTLSNEFISRDEALHCEHAVELHRLLERPCDELVTHDIIRDAVLIEKQFILFSLPCRLIGMNHVLMNQYIEFVADRLLVQLGSRKLYNCVNPFDFMELISLDSKANFFERTVSAYSLADKTKSKNIFEFNAQF